MKFLMFSDFHYNPKALYGPDLETLEKLQKRAEENGCDFLIHAGDFCYGPSTVSELVEVYNDFHIPSYHCLGNHDCDRTPYAEVLDYYRLGEKGYYSFDCKGYRIIVLDTNYYKEGEGFVHYEMRSQFDHPQQLDSLPPEELDWLFRTVEESPFPCLIISHASFERECVLAKNEEEMIALSHEANASIYGKQIREFVKKTNEKSPHKILMLMNGHHHKDFLRIIDNTIYWDVNTTRYELICEKPHDVFPEEICKKHILANRTMVYNEPLSAVVTVEGTSVTIDGVETEAFMGVTRETHGDWVLDRSGRPSTPRITSAKITLE